MPCDSFITELLKQMVLGVLQSRSLTRQTGAQSQHCVYAGGLLGDSMLFFWFCLPKHCWTFEWLMRSWTTADTEIHDQTWEQFVCVHVHVCVLKRAHPIYVHVFESINKKMWERISLQAEICLTDIFGVSVQGIRNIYEADLMSVSFFIMVRARAREETVNTIKQ